jgi:ELWxxDGT repeat protein
MTRLSFRTPQAISWGVLEAALRKPRIRPLLLRGVAIIATIIIAMSLLVSPVLAAPVAPAERAAHLVKDIAPGQEGSSAHDFTVLAGSLYLVANDGAHGRELWKSDGSETGTVLLRDINPGSASSLSSTNGRSRLTTTDVDGTLFFGADDGAHGYELWKSDGTKAGTVLVKDIVQGAEDSSPGFLTDVAGTLFFGADDGAHGYELWKSDGTKAGTVLVKDIKPGRGSSFLPFDPLTDVGGTLYFGADDGTHGVELWKSDGTKAGTAMVRDIVPGPGSSFAADQSNHIADAAGTVYFTAGDPDHGFELWKSDGTTAGTILVKDIAPGPLGSGTSSLTDVAGALFFAASDGSDFGLWKSDGTEAGTVIIKDHVAARRLTLVEGKLFFAGYKPAYGWELWNSDGTEAGTAMVKDISPGPDWSFPIDLSVAGDLLYFGADDGVHGDELWTTDGTEAGTILVKDLYRGSHSSMPRSIIPFNGALFFGAKRPSTGRELWMIPAG